MRERTRHLLRFAVAAGVFFGYGAAVQVILWWLGFSALDRWAFSLLAYPVGLALAGILTVLWKVAE